MAKRVLTRGSGLTGWIRGQSMPVEIEQQARVLIARERLGRDYYHRVLRLSWPAFGGLILLAFLVMNVVFALVYLGIGGISGVRPGNFVDAFFFSAQMFVTLSFGNAIPKTVVAETVVAAETVVGLLNFASITSLMYARFARPTARILFSDSAVICAYNGVPTLMFRAANQRGNQILQAQVRVTLVRAEISPEGIEMRRIYDLPLTREYNSVFTLTWTMMHPIDERSPLRGHSLESLAASDAFIVVLLAGIDDTFNDTVHARYLYGAGDLRWNERFVDLFSIKEDGTRFADYAVFHDTEPCAPPPLGRSDSV